MKKLTDDTMFARALAWLARAVFRRPRLFFYPQVLLLIACVWYSLPKPYGHLAFDTSRDNLVGSNKKYHQNFLRFKEDFPQQDDMVVVVESDNEEKNRQFVDRVEVKIEAETNVFKDALYKGDLKI